MTYEGFLNCVHEQLKLILTDNIRNNLNEEYVRYKKEGNKESKKIIVRHILDSYTKAIEIVCSRGTDEKRVSDNKKILEDDNTNDNQIENDSRLNDIDSSLSEAFSNSEIRMTQIRAFGGDLWGSLCSVLNIKTVGEKEEKNSKKIHPIDSYDPNNASERSLTEYIIICIDKNYRFAEKGIQNRIDPEEHFEKSKVVRHTYSILKELASGSEYDCKYAEDMKILRDMLTVDGNLRIYDRKPYNYSDEILDKICDIIRKKYAEKNVNLNAIKLREKLAIHENLKKENQVRIAQYGEDPDDANVIEVAAPDQFEKETNNNAEIWKKMDELIESELKKGSPSSQILAGKDVFFFKAIIELGWGYGFIDRYPHLCEKRMLDYVVANLKKGQKPTLKMLAKDYFNKTPAAVTKYYNMFKNLIRENISEY